MDSKHDVNCGIQISNIDKRSNVSPKLAILLTLRYDKNEKESFHNLTRFADSLQNDPIANYHVFLGFECDDVKFQQCMPQIQTLFAESKITFIKIEDQDIINKKPFPVCKVWRKLAFVAKDAGNEYEFFVFLGDDIELKEDWYQEMLKSFVKLKEKAFSYGYKQQENIGIVCLKEENDPNWPSFPVICRSHLDIFNEIFCNEFINQDADPYLFELYRRFGLAMFTHHITLVNHKGGVTGGLTRKEPRYRRAYFPWKTKLLTNSVQKLKTSFDLNDADVVLIDTVDIIIPCYRINQVGPKLYDNFINEIIVPNNMDIRYVLVIDRPLNAIESEVIKLLKDLQHKSNIRIRVNYINKGVSYTRSRGIQECHSDFAVFLDDDVIPENNILIELQKAIHSKQGENSTGFVGLSILPRDGRYASSAFHMAQTSFFWEIAKHFKYVPWGVTAFLCCKWEENMRFDEDFPKTGGGEDIAFCIDHLKGQEKKIMAVPTAKVTHPWWHNAKRWPLYKRCIHWAIGDGLLLDKYAQFTFYTLPNILEMTLFLSLIFVILFVLFGFFYQQILKMLVCCYIMMLFMLWIFEFSAGIAWIYYKRIDAHIVGFHRFWIAFESNFIRNSSEFGHIYGHIKRLKFCNLCKRFDWFLSTYDEGPQYEWNRSVFHFTFFVVAISITTYISCNN